MSRRHRCHSVLVALLVCAIGAPAARADLPGLPPPPPGPSLPPTVVLGQPTLSGCDPGSTETLTGTVNPNGQDTTWHFEYAGPGGSTVSTPGQSAGSGTSDVPVSAAVTLTEFGALNGVVLVATNASSNSTDTGGAIARNVPPQTPVWVQCATARVAAIPSESAPSFGQPIAEGPTCSGAPVTFSVPVSGVVTPAHIGFTAMGTAVFTYGPTTGYGLYTAGAASTFADSPDAPPATISATIARLPVGTTHVALQMTSERGDALRGPDATITIPPVTCPSTHTAAVNVPWSLVGTSHRHHTVTIRFQPPCGATKSPAHVSVTRLSHHRVRITVTMRAFAPAPTCSGPPAPAEQRTIHIPSDTARFVHVR